MIELHGGLPKGEPVWIYKCSLMTDQLLLFLQYMHLKRLLVHGFVVEWMLETHYFYFIWMSGVLDDIESNRESILGKVKGYVSRIASNAGW